MSGSFHAMLLPGSSEKQDGYLHDASGSQNCMYLHLYSVSTLETTPPQVSIEL